MKLKFLLGDGTCQQQTNDNMDSGNGKENAEQFHEFIKQFRAESLPKIITDIFDVYFSGQFAINNCTNEQFVNIPSNVQMIHKTDNIPGMFVNNHILN